MKTSFWTIAAAALLLAGCSKEELTNNMSDGASLVATPTNGNARLGRAGDQPSVKFKNNRIVIGLNNSKTEEDVPLDAILEDGGGSVVLTNTETTPHTVLELSLSNTNENENQRYRTPQFEMAESFEYGLFDIEIRDAQGEYLWGASIFVLADGKAVENNPIVKRTGLVGRWDFDDSGAQDNSRLVVVLGDDPTQQVADVKFLQNPVSENPDDPTAVVEFEPVTLEQTHFNPALGISRWIGRDWSGNGPTNVSGAIYLNSSNIYDVDFLAGETNAQIVGKYNVDVNELGEVSSEISDEPEILGSRIETASFGESWKMEVAVADLGDWAESARFVLEEIDGSNVGNVEIPLELTRVEGNLRVFTYSGVILNLNPDGGELEGTLHFAKGPRRGRGRLRAAYINALRNEEL